MLQRDKLAAGGREFPGGFCFGGKSTARRAGSDDDWSLR
jgi:hypothetical protein